MAAPTRISIVALSGNGPYTGITVPSDAIGVVAMWGEYGAFSTGMTALSSSFATFSTSNRQQSPSVGGVANGAGVWWADITSTGTGQTLTPTWSGTPIQGPLMTLFFYKDITAGAWVRAMVSAIAGASFPLSLASSTDDQVLVLDSQDSSIPSALTGFTTVNSRTESFTGGRFQTADSPGASTTSIPTNSANPATAAISIIGASGGGGTAAQAESITFSDSQVGAAKFLGAQSETISFSDSQTGVAKFIGAQSETITFSDSQVASQKFTGAQAESITFADSQDATQVQGAVSEETISFSDSQTAVLTAVAVQDEGITFSDSQVATQVSAAAQDETITFSDSQIGVLKFTDAQSETITFSDSQEATQVQGAISEETISFSDSQTAEAHFVGVQEETIVFVDSQDAVEPGQMFIVETITFSDSQDAVGHYQVSQDETITFVDSQTATGGEEPAPRGGAWAPQLGRRRREENDILMVDLVAAIKELAPTKPQANKIVKVVKRATPDEKEVNVTEMLQVLEKAERSIQQIVERAAEKAKIVARRRRQDNEIMMLL